jgi:hypothetical protein
LIATVEKNGKRAFNNQDKFSFSYNTNYNTTILGQGSVGDIKFYVDHFINEPIFAVYTDDNEEFIFDIDIKMIREKGIEFYLGFILKLLKKNIIRKSRMTNLRWKPNQLVILRTFLIIQVM